MSRRCAWPGRAILVAAMLSSGCGEGALGGSGSARFIDDPGAGGTGGSVSGTGGAGSTGGPGDIPDLPGSAPSTGTAGITDYWCPRWNELKRTGLPDRVGEAGSAWEYYEKGGEVDVAANDVTIRCLRIAKSGGVGDYGLITCEDGCGEGFLLEDTHTDLTDRDGDYGVAMRMGSDEMAVRRFYTHLGCDGIKMGGGLFQDSFIEDTKGRTGVGDSTWPSGWVGSQGFPIGESERDYCNRADPHSDAIQDAGSQRGPVWVIGNRIESPWQAPNAGMQISDGYQHDMTVIGNWFQGGGVASAFNIDKGGWGDMVFFDNEVVRDSWAQAGFHTSWEGNAAVFDGGEIGQGTGCVEAIRNGDYANRYTDLDASGDDDGGIWDDSEKGGFPGRCTDPDVAGRGCVSGELTCGREQGWPPDTRAGGDWTHVTPIPIWNVRDLQVAGQGRCASGSSDCDDVGFSASASGATPRGEGANGGSYETRWRYNCGGSPSNRLSPDPTPPGSYQDGGADLWYPYPACDGLSTCAFDAVCDFGSEAAGTYVIKVYGESGPGSGVRASDHAEIEFVVDP